MSTTLTYQALAIHELRAPFRPVFWTEKHSGQTVEQVWFAGAHANVGGGYTQVGLSSYALDWMAFKAQTTGLELDTNYFKAEIGNRSLHERVAISRNFGHGPSSTRDRKAFRKLERPVDPGDIDKYLWQYFPGSSLHLDVASGIWAHWSVPDRLQDGPSYDDEVDSFSRLDQISSALPATPRKESLT